MKHNYYSQDSEEPRPALYIELTRPGDDKPFLKDRLAPLDTGASLTAIPIEYQDSAGLRAHDYTEIIHGGYHNPRCPKYLAEVTAEEYKPRTVEIVFLPTVHQPLIGRNLMKYWHTTLKGPEQILEIAEP